MAYKNLVASVHLNTPDQGHLSQVKNTLEDLVSRHRSPIVEEFDVMFHDVKT